MARIEGNPRPGWLTRLIYWVVRRRFGRVPEPLRITAHSPWVLASTVGYEVFSPRARVVAERGKELASILVAMRIGCPF